MTDIDLDDDDLTPKQEAEIRKKAQERCEQWNWNCNIAEIAKELIDEEMDLESRRFEIYGEEFVKFYGSEESWEICKQIMETFA